MSGKVTYIFTHGYILRSCIKRQFFFDRHLMLGKDDIPEKCPVSNNRL